MNSQTLNNTGKLTKKELIVLIISAVITITLVSACSPLYPFNPWDDANCFFTLGRGIIHGFVPYRDLYEQKGPLLYFIYALAALISEKTFVGAWIFECIAASVYAIYSWKIVKLFVRPSKTSLVLIPVMIGCVYTLKMFNFGGNAEELCFPLLTIALFIMLRSIVVNDSLPTGTEALLCGVITAALFWIKYTFLGFFVGFILILLVYAFIKKDFKKLLSLIWRYLVGFAVLSAPIIIYFLANGALNSLWEAYFYNNMFLYHDLAKPEGLGSIPIIRNIYFPLASLYISFKNFPAFGILLLLSLISVFLVDKKYRKRSVITFFSTFATMLLFTFTKASFIYYYGYILAYCFCFSLIIAVKLINKLTEIFKNHASFFSLISTILLSLIYLLLIITCKNMYLIFKPRDFLSQFRIAETIKETPDAKLLTYDVMDSGFFTSADIMPSNRFYCFLNIESTYPAILEEQNSLIESGYYDYIVTSYYFEADWDNYELVQTETGEYADAYELYTEGYKLYKRI